MTTLSLRITQILTADELQFFEPTDDASVFLYREDDGSTYRVTLWDDESLNVAEEGTPGTRAFLSVWEWMRDGWTWGPGINEHTARYWEACAELMRIQMRLYPHLRNDV